MASVVESQVIEILVFHRVKVNEGCYHNVMLLKQLLPAIQVLHLSAGQCPAHIVLEEINFLTYFLPITSPDIDRF